MDPSSLGPAPQDHRDGGKDEPTWLVDFEPSIVAKLNRGPTGVPMFRFVPVYDTTDPGLEPASSLASTTGSVQSLAFVMQKFQQCARDHKQCNNSRERGWLPTRLISLENVLKDATVSLVTSRDVKTENYCTLSHCWGSTEILKLNKANAGPFHRGIRLSDLPRTFQDSFRVTLQLGVWYIWVDSLCIVQDDADDWLNEASQMHKVYSNSICNINATCARDSSAGLFASRDPAVFEPCEVLIPWFEGGGLFRILDMETWNTQVLEAPLNRRAWVAQEHLLAPRHVHFSAPQIYWECVETTASEQFEEEIPAEILLRGQSSRRRLHQIEPSILRGAAWSQQLRSDWSEIVRRYTKCQLTHWKDRPIAFSGIARKFEVILGEKCEAGLWRGDIVRDLLWHVLGCRKGDETPSERPSFYRAPSFSWMAVEGTIICCEDEQTDAALVEVLSFTTRESKGAIVSGSVRLKGMLRTLRLDPQKDTNLGLWVPKFRHGKPELGWATSLTSSALMDIDEDYTDTYYCILLSTTFLKSWTAGIVLRETGQVKGEFTRIGLLQCSGEDRELIKAHRADEELYPSEAYDPIEKTHTISIV